MVTIKDENYLNASEAAGHLGINRDNFYDNVKPYLRGYIIGARKRILYKQVDLKPFEVIRVVEPKLPLAV